MIAGFSKAVILYLSPLVALTAVLLSLFAFLAPTFLLHDQVALITVTSSTALIKDGGSQIDGPSVFMGVLGSCARVKHSAHINCTVPTMSTAYDLSVLPANAPRVLLTAPAASVPLFIAIGISLSILFFFLSTIISFRHKMGPKVSAMFGKPMLLRISTWIGVVGFVLGLASFVILRIWFGKSVDDFNGSIKLLGGDAPALVAGMGNAFTMIWVAYAFYAVPVIASLSRVDATAMKA